MRLLSQFRNFACDQSGPTSVEYAFMIGAIAMVALVAVVSFGHDFNALVISIGTLIERSAEPV